MCQLILQVPMTNDEFYGDNDDEDIIVKHKHSNIMTKFFWEGFPRKALKNVVKIRMPDEAITLLHY